MTQNAAIDHAAGLDENDVSFTLGYQVTDGDGDTANGTLVVNVDDDTPTVSANLAVQLDDDALTGGNPGGVGDVDPDTANVSGTLGHSFGADGGSIAWLTDGAPEGFSYELSGSDLLVKQDGTTVLTATLNTATGAYTVTQIAAIDHAAGLDENDVSFTLTYQVTDGDGDTANGTLVVNVDDDTPVAIDPDYAFMKNVIGAGETDVPLDLDSNIDDNVGADQVGNLAFTAANQALFNGYTSGQNPIYLYVSSDGQTLIGSTYATGTDAADANVLSAKVFTVQLNTDGLLASASDTYSFTLHQPIDGGQTTFTVQDAGYNFEGGNDPYSYFDDTIINDANGDQDVLLTPMIDGVSDGTTNTSAIAGGVGSGNSIGPDGGLAEGMRVDFVNGIGGDPSKNVNDDYSNTANWDHTFTGHNTVNGATAVITSTSGSTILVRAFDDPDGNMVVGDGVQDEITRVLVSYAGETQAFTITDGFNSGLVTIGGEEFSVIKAGDGVLIGGVQGDGGSSPLNYTEITVFTADGLTTVDYTWQTGDTFKIGGFGAAVAEPGEVIELTFDLALTDGDGDTVALPDALKVVLSPEDHDVHMGTDGVDLMDYSASPNAVTLVGLDGDDTLVGSDYNDILMGGPGNDTLTGGDSGDTFKFLQGDLGNGVDTITDFEVGIDTLDLADLFDTPPAGLLSDYVHISDPVGGTVDISVDVDGAGGEAPVQIATVTMIGLDPTDTTGADVLDAIQSQIKTEMP